MTTLLLLLALHGFFLGGLLMVAGHQRDESNRLLGALVLTAGVVSLSFWLGTQQQRWQVLAAAALFPAWYLIGPLSLRYTQRFLRRQPTTSIWWVALAPLLALVWSAVWLQQPAALRADRGAQTVHVAVLYSGFWILTACCALRSWQILRAAETDADWDARPTWHRAWLRCLMALLLVFALLDFVMTCSFTLWGSYPAWLGMISVASLTTLVYAVGLVALMPDGVMQRVGWPGRRYERARLPESAASQHKAALRRLMEVEKIWLNDDLDLRRLAAALDISSHQLSQLLSQHLDTSFADYVNGYRVAHAVELLADQSRPRSVLDIGFESGFGSSATFYRAFRKHQGMTPRAFVAALSDSEDETNASAEIPNDKRGQPRLQ